MSVTTSTNTISQGALRLLADYELHHSGDPEPDGNIQGQNPRDAEQEQAAENPEWWPDNWRRIPPHRPINRNLDREMRPAGSFLIESVFILSMLGGVAINAHMSTFWRNTGGRLNERLFTYPIGGER